MGFLDFYLKKEDTKKITSIHKIVNTIIEQEAEKADNIAMVAFLLARVAYCDLDVSEEEKLRIKSIVKEKYGFSQETANLIMELAVAQNIQEGSSDNYLVAREFKNSTSIEEREDFLRFLFEVACADKDISPEEEAELKVIGQEFGIPDSDFVLIRREFSEYRLGRSKN